VQFKYYLLNKYSHTFLIESLVLFRYYDFFEEFASEIPKAATNQKYHYKND